MGVYDTFGKEEVQLKCGVNELRHYDIGDRVLFPDGAYVGYEGIVVIYKGKLVAVVKGIWNKWGEPIEINLNKNNIVCQTIEKFMDKEKK